MRKSEALKLFRARAFDIDRAVGHIHFTNPVEEIRTIIARQEKQHRRLAPDGYRHTLPIARAVDYFVCKTFADGLNLARKGSINLRDLEGMREDYLKAAIVAGKYADRLSSIEWRPLRAALEEWEYSRLVNGGEK